MYNERCALCDTIAPAITKNANNRLAGWMIHFGTYHHQHIPILHAYSIPFAGCTMAPTILSFQSYPHCRKVDVDDNSETAADYDITGVPTFILFNDGEQVGRFSGADIDKLSNSVAKLDEE